MVTKACSVRFGISQNSIGRNILPVWSAENASVDKEKITAAQQSAGSQAISNRSRCGV